MPVKKISIKPDYLSKVLTKSILNSSGLSGLNPPVAQDHNPRTEPSSNPA
jgi:hypothetical protein